MTAPSLTIAPAGEAHLAAIIVIERDAGGASVVALTHGHALREAMARGHDVIVAIEGDSVAGWAWFSLDDGRGGDLIGQLYRVAVTANARRGGTGGALLAYARASLRERGCTRIRATISAGDDGAVAFFRAAGFADDAIIVEATL